MTMSKETPYEIVGRFDQNIAKYPKVIEKLKNTECVAIEEIPSELHGSFWKHLVKIKNSNNEYQLL